MTIETKLCIICNKDLPLDSFGKRKNITGYKSVPKYHCYCKPCSAEKARKWRKDNKGYRGTGKLTKIPKEDRKLYSCLSQRVTDSKTREKKRKIDINVDNYIDANFLYSLWLKQEGKCALSNEPMDIIKNSLGNVSLDKIDPSKTYTQDNVQLVCWAINRAKGEMSQSLFVLMCEKVVNQNVQRLSKG